MLEILYDQGKDYLQELIKLVGRYENMVHHDDKIEEVFKQYLTYVWRYSVTQLFECLDTHSELDSVLLESLFAKSVRVSADPDMMKRLMQYKNHYEEKCKIVLSLIDQNVLQSIHLNSTPEELSYWLFTYQGV